MRSVGRYGFVVLLMLLASNEGWGQTGGAGAQRPSRPSAAAPASAQPPATAPAAEATPPASAASPTATIPADPAAPGAAGEFKLDGFRSARFGMSEAQVRASIKKDFPAAGDRIVVERNGAERTTALAVTVDDLLPDSGPARVAYILGYKTKQLIQVNIVWGEPLTREPSSETLVTTANGLTQYFFRQGFKPENVAINTRMSDGSIVVFRGTDAQNRMVLLRLVTAARPAAADKPAEAGPPRSLWLSYIKDPQSPDVFRIERGQF